MGREKVEWLSDEPLHGIDVLEELRNYVSKVRMVRSTVIRGGVGSEVPASEFV